jgi:hypothetical protein
MSVLKRHIKIGFKVLNMFQVGPAERKLNEGIVHQVLCPVVILIGQLQCKLWLRVSPPVILPKQVTLRKYL